MTWDIAITLAVLLAVVVGLSVLRAGPDLILLGGLALLLLAGVVGPIEAFAGFGNEGLITVALLYIVAEGLRQTGAVSFISQQLLGHPKSVLSAQARVVAPVAVASAFLNNTPVVAMLLPVIHEWSKKHRISVSYLLMPLSYAAILGGLCTLIGTSTTLVVNGLLIETLHRSLGLFEIGAVGLPAAVLGLAYLLLFSRRLLKDRKPAMTLLQDPREYTVEMLVEPHSPLVGKTIEDAGLRHLTGMYLMEIDRGDHVLAAVSPHERIQGHDRLVFVGIVESVVELQRIPGLRPATDQVFKLNQPRSERCLIEAVVSDSCPILRQTIREAKFRTRYNAAVIAVARSGERIRKKIGDIVLQPGDTLLLEAHPSFLEQQRNSRDFFLVSAVEDSTPPRHERAWVARTILAAMVLTVALGLLSMLKAALAAAMLMIATRCCRASEAKRAVDLTVLLVIGAGLGIGKAVELSGAASFLAHHLIAVMGSHPWLVLATVYAITMVLTNLITAKAAAVLIFPIAMAAAENLSVQLGAPVDPMPFAIAVMMAAAASFATPVGYQTNLMVIGPGGYRASDFLRLGVPLSLLIWAVTVFLAPIVWPF
ncbi:MAG: SLC13 family permease [Planctomycetes bacterium]|nr:SLC13 family permease [Planctomycetota bacterium]